MNLSIKGSADLIYTSLVLDCRFNGISPRWSVHLVKSFTIQRFIAWW